MKWQLQKLFPYVVTILPFEKSKFMCTWKYDLPYGSTRDIINKLIKSLNLKRTKGPDGISAKLVKILGNVLDSHFANIANNDISLNKYSKRAKTTTVRPIFKKMDKNKLSPSKSLNIFFLKICKRFLYENLTNIIDTFFSKFIFAYCKFLSFKSRIDSFNGKLKKILRWEKKSVGAVIMGLSKVFYSMPHDLLIAKIYVYGFSINVVILFYLYLKRRRQNVIIIYTRSIFPILLSGVPKVQ